MINRTGWGFPDASHSAGSHSAGSSRFAGRDWATWARRLAQDPGHGLTATVKGKGSERHGQTARGGPGLPEAPPGPPGQIPHRPSHRPPPRPPAPAQPSGPPKSSSGEASFFKGMNSSWVHEPAWGPRTPNVGSSCFVLFARRESRFSEESKSRKALSSARGPAPRPPLWRTCLPLLNFPFPASHLL